MDSILIGVAERDPFEASYAPTTPGVFAFTAVATFDSGETETSDPAYVTVVAPGFDDQDHHDPSPSISATISGNTVQLGVQTELGHSYYLEYKTNLNQPDWKTLDQAQGDGLIKKFFDNVTNDNSRFYRTRRVP